MSTPATDSFLFGDHRVTVTAGAYYDLIFFAPYEWCQFLLDRNGWRYLDEACHVFHRDHVKMLADCANIEVEKLPEEVRHPIDGTVRDIPTLIRFLAASSLSQRATACFIERGGHSNLRINVRL